MDAENDRAEGDAVGPSGRRARLPSAPLPAHVREDLSTTALYTKVTDARLAGAVAALPSFRPVVALPLIGPASVPGPEQGN